MVSIELRNYFLFDSNVEFGNFVNISTVAVKIRSRICGLSFFKPLFALTAEFSEFESVDLSNDMLNPQYVTKMRLKQLNNQTKFVRISQISRFVALSRIVHTKNTADVMYRSTIRPSHKSCNSVFYGCTTYVSTRTHKHMTMTDTFNCTKQINKI